MSIAHARVLSMVEASFLTDTATMPLHWIYDQLAVSSKVEGRLSGVLKPSVSKPMSAVNYRPSKTSDLSDLF